MAVIFEPSDPKVRAAKTEGEAGAWKVSGAVEFHVFEFEQNAVTTIAGERRTHLEEPKLSASAEIEFSDAESEDQALKSAAQKLQLIANACREQADKILKEIV